MSKPFSSDVVIVGLLLAAGKSSRFRDAQGKPADKLQAQVEVSAVSRMVIEHSVSALLSACPRSIAIMKPDSPHITHMQTMGLQTVIAQRADEGMGHSLAAGAQAAIAQGASAVIVMLADMPFIKTETLHAIATQLQAGAQIVVPRYQGVQGHPVGFSAAFLPELAVLKGDVGAKAVLRAHAAAITYLDVPDESILQDVDTRESINISAS